MSAPTERFDPRHWRPGDRITPAETGYGADVRALKERKHDGSGWWLTDGMGLSDKAAGLGWTIARDTPATEVRHATDVIAGQGNSFAVAVDAANALAAAGLLRTAQEAAVIDAAKAWVAARRDVPGGSMQAVRFAVAHDQLIAAVDALVSQEQAEGEG